MSSGRSGERKLQILQALAQMLEQPQGEKITTAALAQRLSLSEAALYRHFASKAQMFEGLIEFIETTVFGLVNQIAEQEKSGLMQAQAMIIMLLNFAERNPGMTRVLTGDVLANEDGRLQFRMNQFYDRVELAFRQSLRIAAAQGYGKEDEAGIRAGMIVAFVAGRWQRYAKTGFKISLTEEMPTQIRLLLV
ncbi:MAG: nucleoid occlusion factor SlmA [Betaproteobacteria bacterium]|nr:nucleoid occlusion factor SlmA [Betaproteobacteria bacterium]